jgi:hypothetical protein
MKRTPSKGRREQSEGLPEQVEELIEAGILRREGLPKELIHVFADLSDEEVQTLITVCRGISGTHIRAEDLRRWLLLPL